MHVQPATPVGLEHRRDRAGACTRPTRRRRSRDHGGGPPRRGRTPSGPRSPSARARRTRRRGTPPARSPSRRGGPRARGRSEGRRPGDRGGLAGSSRSRKRAPRSAPLPHRPGHATRGPVRPSRTLSGVEAEERIRRPPRAPTRARAALDEASDGRPAARPTAAEPSPTSAASIIRAEAPSPDAAPATSRSASRAPSRSEAARLGPECLAAELGDPRSRCRRSPTRGRRRVVDGGRRRRPGPARHGRSVDEDRRRRPACSARGSRASDGRWWRSWRPRSLLPAAWWFRQPSGSCRRDARARRGIGVAVGIGPRDRLPTDVPGCLVGPVGRGPRRRDRRGRSDRESHAWNGVPGRVFDSGAGPPLGYRVEKHPAARARGG